ncbi:tautomerase family protein [Undibacterium sp. TJN19]|uniref:tautomerase family protein n=1 Tax=Undibacterium sp. TJN19 TaxID=3413055 RepID=UPI003BF28011
MPFARISLLKGKPVSYLKALSDGIYQALVDAYEVPLDDCFQAIHQHAPEELIFDRHYLSRGGARSDDYVLICITGGRERSKATKQAFYQRVVELLGAAPGLRPQDIMIIINTTTSDDWSLSSGHMGIGQRASLDDTTTENRAAT